MTMNFEDYVAFHVTIRSHYCEKSVIISFPIVANIRNNKLIAIS